MKYAEALPPAEAQEAEMAKVALSCLMKALDHSRAPTILLVDETGDRSTAPELALPPQALRFFADVLRMIAQQQPVVLMSPRHMMSTQDAAAFLNVSRPFVIKEIEAGRLNCQKVNRHRRIEFNELKRYQLEQQEKSESAMQKLVTLSESLGLDF